MRNHNSHPVFAMLAQKTDDVHVVCHSEANMQQVMYTRVVECTWLRFGTDRLVCIDRTLALRQ